MKRISGTLLALAACVAISPAAFAASIYSFSLTGPGGISASGTFVAWAPSGDVLDVSDITGTFSYMDSIYPAGGISDATITGLVPGDYSSTDPSQTPAGNSGGDNNWYTLYDNLFYPDNNAPNTPAVGLLDSSGLLFTLNDGYSVNIFDEGGTAGYAVNDQQGSYSDPYDPIGTEGLTFTTEFVGFTPEPDSLILMGTGLLGLAFVMFRKTRQSGAVWHF